MTTKTSFYRESASKWMSEHLHEFVDDCGDVDSTRIAEECAAEFGEDYEGGPLDDPDHWIWEVAVEMYYAHDRSRPRY